MAGSNVSAKIYYSSALPATYDIAGYSALTWVEHPVLSIGELGDTAAEVAVTPLSGRKKYYVGELDGGKIQIEAEDAPSNAGQVIADGAMNNDVDKAVKIVNANGDAFYFYGKFANKKHKQRDTGQADNITFEIWRNGAVV